jgi:hypothetical protein
MSDVAQGFDDLPTVPFAYPSLPGVLKRRDIETSLGGMSSAHGAPARETPRYTEPHYRTPLHRFARPAPNGMSACRRSVQAADSDASVRSRARWSALRAKSE